MDRMEYDPKMAAFDFDGEQKRDQTALVKALMLPKQVGGATRKQLEALGFKFGDDFDELFVKCEYPPGWQKRPADHPMHIDLVDEQGRKRAGIFFKATSHDRRATMGMKGRFYVDAYRAGSQKGCFRCVVTDGDEVLFDAGERGEGDFEKGDEMKGLCEHWLDEKHPDWRNPLAYWDTDQPLKARGLRR